jgi:cell division protein FtsB
MKEQNKHNKQENPSKLNIWKIVALVVIALFAGTLIFGVIKLQRFKQTLVDPTDTQVESAKTLALQDIEKRGFNTSEYDIKVAPKVRGMSEAGENRNIIQVFAEANASRHNYLIDTDSGMILLHSQTETYGWMADMDRKMMPPRATEGAPQGCIEGPNGSEKECQHEMPGRAPGFPMYLWHNK